MRRIHSPHRWTRLQALALVVWVLCAYYSITFRVAAQSQPQPDATLSVWNAVYTDEQAKRGEGLYLEECATCHLADLTGEDYALPLVAEFFTLRWTDKTVDDLFQKISTTMPADKPSTLSRQAYTDIVSYILKSNGFPAGQKELDKDSVVLRQIRITRSSTAR